MTLCETDQHRQGNRFVRGVLQSSSVSPNLHSHMVSLSIWAREKCRFVIWDAKTCREYLGRWNRNSHTWQFHIAVTHKCFGLPPPPGMSQQCSPTCTFLGAQETFRPPWNFLDLCCLTWQPGATCWLVRSAKCNPGTVLKFLFNCPSLKFQYPHMAVATVLAVKQTQWAPAHLWSVHKP